MSVPERIVPLDRARGEARDASGGAIDVRNAALTLLAVLAVIVALGTAQAMIIPIVLAVLASYALDPIVTAAGRLRLPRSVSAALVLLALVAGAGSLLYALRGEGEAIVQQVPGAARRLRESFETNRPKGARTIQQVQKAANEIEKAASAPAPPSPPGVTRVQVETPVFNIGNYLVWGSLSVAGAIGQFVLILFLVYFLLASGDLYRRKLVKIAGPSLTEKKVTLQILQDIDHQVETFLLVQLFTSVVVALSTWLSYRALGVHQAAVWGLLVGIFNSIPYFGPVLVTGGAAGVVFMQHGTPHAILVVALVTLAIASVEALLLTPRLTGRAGRMNAVAVFIGLLFWGWLWSIWGLLLAVPMLMVLKAICDHVEDLNPLGELLGN